MEGKDAGPLSSAQPLAHLAAHPQLHAVHGYHHVAHCRMTAPPVPVEVEAVSREAALAQIREALTARRRAGTEIVQITIENGSAALQTAWPRHAGAFPDDEAYRSMLADVERQRREFDEDTEA